MIACTRCNKENQDHYKFCLGCGAELPRDAAQKAKTFATQTPPSGTPKAETKAEVKAPKAAEEKKKPAVPSFGGAPAKSAPQPAKPAAMPAPAPVAAAPAPAATAATTGADTITCEKCSKVNPSSFKFCGACGHNLQEQQAAKGPAAPAPAAAPMAAAPTVAAAAARGSLVVIRPDGTEGESFPLSAGKTVVGRNAGGVFASDSFLSPEHASFAFEGDTLTVTDSSSLNGIYWRVEPEVPVALGDGTVFRIGQEIIRFAHMGKPASVGGVDVMGSPHEGLLGRISLVIGRESTGNSYCVPAEGLHLGRERGDIIFPEDGYVSGLHCRIHKDGSNVVLTDVGSSNGTFIRVSGSLKVPSGMLILMGQQLFRVEY